MCLLPGWHGIERGQAGRRDLPTADGAQLEWAKAALKFLPLPLGQVVTVAAVSGVGRREGVGRGSATEHGGKGMGGNSYLL